MKVLKLKNHFSEKFTRLKEGEKREGHDDAWTHGGRFESFNLKVGMWFWQKHKSFAFSIHLQLIYHQMQKLPFG